ncbi:hypothetical protein [Kaistella polysaccharea]|uniref:hypothetical protein n=1 Tax=Kaistella polysaccharea TaxID=2878534 RepID=UPI001CF1AFF4|nr:hypothetical protein [Kaistella polysaccharea]
MINSSAVGKSFILIIPCDFGIYKLFNENIEKFGLHLNYFIPQEFHYKSATDRAVNFLQKNFFGNRNYKRQLIRQFHSDSVEEKIKHLGPNSVDYILIIRPDTITIETLKHLLKIGKKVVGYQWDGLERYDDIFGYINYFEKFLVFDQNDYLKYKDQYPNLKKCDNFYFDYDDDSPNLEHSKIVYYVGSYIVERADDLVTIVHELEKYDVEFDVNLKYHPSTLPINEKNIKFFKHNFDFKANISHLKKAKILLDFKVVEHDGLSLRFFEALKYSKKIITNNTAVLNYDFYDPQNIFILGHDDLGSLPEFLSSQYKVLPPEIVKQYSFSSWLNRNVL